MSLRGPRLTETPPPGRARPPGLLGSLGPAIIVASVVLGPGSIVTNSSVGWRHGYDLAWVVVSAVVLLAGMTALAARLGVSFQGTPCAELARRAGRPIAALAGLSLFLVASCFQFGNNLGVLYSLEPFLDRRGAASSPALAALVLAGLNALVLLALFRFRRLYLPVERLMKLCVGVMLLGFAANLLLARPEILKLLRGLLPRLPPGGASALLWRDAPGEPPGLPDPLWAVQGLVGTTFSVGGAFYQAYLVRQKGWTRDDLGRGLADSLLGIATLGVLSLMIMVTAAAVLHGNPEVQELRTAADVARQLEPLFGRWAMGLFSLGVLAGSLSSFLVNAMIGGTVLADGLGLGGSMDQPWPRRFTAVVLACGMAVALGVRAAGLNTGHLIVTAQAITVLGNPLLAGSLLWLARREEIRRERIVPAWIELLAALGFAVTLLLSVRTACRLWL